MVKHQVKMQVFLMQKQILVQQYYQEVQLKAHQLTYQLQQILILIMLMLQLHLV
jgi:hypothetical protein